MYVMYGLVSALQTQESCKEGTGEPESDTASTTEPHGAVEEGNI